jgi:lantibiotic leader peptide-processing serine protease
MKRSFALVILFLFVLSNIAFVPPAAAQASSSRYVINFASGRIPVNAAALVAAAGGELVRTLPEVGVAVATSANPLFAKNMARSAAVLNVGETLAHALPSLDAVQITGDPPPTAAFYEPYQWSIRRVKADLAWDINTGSHDTVVAVLDTGIAWNHPDLAPNVVYTKCYSTQPSCMDYPSLSYHGTHVAGTVAATFAYGAVGVGPNLGLASYNVFELVDGEVIAFDDPLWAAMIDAANQGFKVINMSLGGYMGMYEGRDAAASWTAWNRVTNYVIRQGVTVVASAGNGALNVNGAIVHFPGDLPGIINVGATGIRPAPQYPYPGAYDVRAFYSNTGAAVTLAAPGGDCGEDDDCTGTVPQYWLYLIFSTYVDLNPGCAATASCAPSWAWAGGTSMAAPHVSGVAGLVMDHKPQLSPNQVSSILTRSAENLGNRQFFGHGMVDAFAALNAVP